MYVLFTQASRLANQRTSFGKLTVESLETFLRVKFWGDNRREYQLEISEQIERSELAIRTFPPLADLSTGLPARFQVEPSALDFQGLLRHVMGWHVHTQLEQTAIMLADYPQWPLRKIIPPGFQFVKYLGISLGENDELLIGVDLRSGEWTLRCQPPNLLGGSHHSSLSSFFSLSFIILLFSSFFSFNRSVRFFSSLSFLTRRRSKVSGAVAKKFIRGNVKLSVSDSFRGESQTVVLLRTISSDDGDGTFSSTASQTISSLARLSRHCSLSSLSRIFFQLLPRRSTG